jgi:hypothetical protein
LKHHLVSVQAHREYRKALSAWTACSSRPKGRPVLARAHRVLQLEGRPVLVQYQVSFPDISARTAFLVVWIYWLWLCLQLRWRLQQYLQK